MNAIVKSQEDQMKALAQASLTIAQESPGSNAFLKLNRVGYWIFGEDDLEVEEDSQRAVNCQSFAMGYIAWPTGGLGAPIGEQMASIYAAPPVEGNLPAVESRWQRQVAMQLVCLTGEDEGEQVLYQASTMGGTKAFGQLLEQIQKHLGSGKAGKNTMPVLVLESDSYKNKDGIEVNFPIFTIKKWAENLGFDAPEAEEEEEEPEVIEPPKRKRAAKKKAAAPAAEEETVIEEDEVEEADEPEAEEAPTTRRRRRRK